MERWLEGVWVQVRKEMMRGWSEKSYTICLSSYGRSRKRWKVGGAIVMVWRCFKLAQDVDEYMYVFGW